MSSTLAELTRRLPADAFPVIGGELHAEGVALSRIAAEVGSPVYVYSAARLRQRYGALAGALAPKGCRVHFAVKANSNQAVLALLAGMGAGVDTVSGGEVARALAAGFKPEDVIFSGVGKTEAELAMALDVGIHQFNVESVEELRALDGLARGRGRVATVALRVNPNVDAETHAKITTGKKDNKFGIDLERLPALENELRTMAGIRFVGIASHVGSQILSEAPLVKTYRRLAEAVRGLRDRGFAIERLDLGGGFGVAYENELEIDNAAIARVIGETVGDLGVKLAVEPGRTLVADAGVLMSRIVYVKDAGEMQFLILDAAMNDLVRPAMYESHHDIVPVRLLRPDARLVEYDVVGPICESSDTFAKRRKLPEMQPGELIVMATAGAYGATMSSTYNARALVPEVLVDGDRYAVVRRRFGVEDQIALESVPEWLNTATASPGAKAAAE